MITLKNAKTEQEVQFDSAERVESFLAEIDNPGDWAEVVTQDAGDDAGTAATQEPAAVTESADTTGSPEVQDAAAADGANDATQEGEAS